MKVAESAVQFYAEHTSFEQHQKSESLSVWKNSRNNRNSKNNSGQFSSLESRISSSASFVRLSREVVSNRPVKSLAPEVSEEQKGMVDLNIRILQKMFEKITGRKMTVIEPQDIQASGSDITTQDPTQQVNAVEGEGVDEQGFGLVYDYYESHYEHESTSFSSVGKVLTEDGQEIDFSVELNMSREFYTEQSLNVRMGDVLKDPLVVNFAGTAADLTQTKFAFDIDADGQEDQVSFVKEGSGFLALDKNGDNLINDGSELFGPTSGAGFTELAEYDEDGNGWIDENDSIFSKLRIWLKNENGDDQLFALGQKGIGAIYLGHVDTPFALKGAGNELLGQVRSSSVFLSENGGVGTIQQVDLSV